MHLLHQQFGNIVKTEAACSLYKDNLIAQSLEHVAVDKRRYVMEEVLLLHLYKVSMSHYLRSDADNLVHTTLYGEVAHLGIEFFQRFACLIDIAEDKRASLSLVVRTTVHKVEGYVERIDIRVIRVVDKRTSVDSLLHLQAHCHRLKSLHALCYVLLGESEMERHDGCSNGVSYGSLIYERKVIFSCFTFIYIMYSGREVLLLHLLHEKCGAAVLH